MHFYNLRKYTLIFGVLCTLMIMTVAAMQFVIGNVSQGLILLAIGVGNVVMDVLMIRQHRKLTTLERAKQDGSDGADLGPEQADDVPPPA